MHKFLFPQYVLKANTIIAVSNTTKEHLMKFLNVNEEKISTIYEGSMKLIDRKLEKMKPVC